VVGVRKKNRDIKGSKIVKKIEHWPRSHQQTGSRKNLLGKSHQSAASASDEGEKKTSAEKGRYGGDYNRVRWEGWGGQQ